VSDKDDSRQRTVGDREYTMVSSETWIDVKDVTVNIFKGKEGVKVMIYPRYTIDNAEPLAVCEAEYLSTTSKRHNVIPFRPRDLR